MVSLFQDIISKYPDDNELRGKLTKFSAKLELTLSSPKTKKTDSGMTIKKRLLNTFSKLTQKNRKLTWQSSSTSLLRSV